MMFYVSNVEVRHDGDGMTTVVRLKQKQLRMIFVDKPQNDGLFPSCTHVRK